MTNKPYSHYEQYTGKPGLHAPNNCQGEHRKLFMIMHAYRWFVFVVASLAFLMLWGDTGMAAPYVQAAAHLHDSDFDEMEAHGNLDFPIVLELSVGYESERLPGWYAQATHYSNPEAADTGLNLIGIGYRHTFWGKK